jgi:hypothetical protein
MRCLSDVTGIPNSPKANWSRGPPPDHCLLTDYSVNERNDHFRLLLSKDPVCKPLVPLDPLAERARKEYIAINTIERIAANCNWHQGQVNAAKLKLLGNRYHWEEEFSDDESNRQYDARIDGPRVHPGCSSSFASSSSTPSPSAYAAASAPSSDPPAYHNPLPPAYRTIPISDEFEDYYNDYESDIEPNDTDISQASDEEVRKLFETTEVEASEENWVFPVGTEEPTLTELQGKFGWDSRYNQEGW